MHPLILQRLLKHADLNKSVEVINAGFPAYSTAHLFIVLMLDVISWSPDLVIISANVNDLDVEYIANFQMDYSNKYKILVPDYYKDYTVMNVLFRWSSFYWFLKGKIESNPISKSYSKTELVKTLDNNEPLKISQYVYRRNLLNFYYIAHNWGIPVLYATQPMDFSKTPKFAFLTSNPLSKRRLETIEQHHKFFNKIIKDVATHTNSYFLDNDSLFEGDHKYFIDEEHYSKAGIEKLAHNYCDYIISQNIIK